MDETKSINIGDTVKYDRKIPGDRDTEIFLVVMYAGEICLREIHKGYYLGAVTWRDIRRINHG
jgi:hypothetical protein